MYFKVIPHRNTWLTPFWLGIFVQFIGPSFIFRIKVVVRG